MADCSYANCVQERRFIKRELLKWNKDMLFIVGEFYVFFPPHPILLIIKKKQNKMLNEYLNCIHHLTTLILSTVLQQMLRFHLLLSDLLSRFQYQKFP